MFDTLLVQHGRPIQVDAHVARLTASAEELFGIVLDPSELCARVDAEARRGPALQRLRLTVVPGGTRARVTGEPLAERPTTPWSLHAGVSPGLGRHKWVDRTPLDALPGAPWGPATDPLLVDGHGMVLEAGRGNVFVVHDGAVTTPPLDGRILPGIVRAQVVGLLGVLQVEVREAAVSSAALAEADEVFVTSSIGGVRPAVSCAGIGSWTPGPVTEHVRLRLERAWSLESP